MTRLSALFGVVGSLSGCAFSDGDPYGVVSATLEAHYELRDDRDVGEVGWQKLTSELQLRLDEARLDVDVVQLIDRGTSVGALAFDPANPPPGYTLCHNGHCHSVSGDLVDYADVQAELAAGEATSSTALALEGGTQDLLSDATTVLDCGPKGGDEMAECQLDAGYISLVRATASRLEVAGAIRDGLAEPRFVGERPFEATILLLPTSDDDRTPGVLETAVDLPLDDDNPSQISLTLSIVATAALFDGLDAEALAASLDDMLSFDDDPSIRGAFAELSLGVGIERTDP